VAEGGGIIGGERMREEGRVKMDGEDKFDARETARFPRLPVGEEERLLRVMILPLFFYMKDHEQTRLVIERDGSAVKLTVK
jgi:hypothetical protein